ncbi:unnamed protein product [Rotaria sp. Silwood1]|nr:unnamed protein product [Rotaria sp. Silwood1]
MNTTSNTVSSTLLALPYQLNICIGLFIWVTGNIGCIGNAIVFSSRTLSKRAYAIYLLWEALSDFIYFNFLLLTRILQKGFQIPITTNYEIICKLRHTKNGICAPRSGIYATFDSYVEAIFTAMGTPIVMIVLAFLLIRSVRSVIQRRIAPDNNGSLVIIVQGSILQQIDSRLTLMLILQLTIAIMTRIPYAVQVIYTNITQNWSKSALQIAIENAIVEFIHLLSYTFFTSSFYVSFISNSAFRRQFKKFFRKSQHDDLRIPTNYTRHINKINNIQLT